MVYTVISNYYQEAHGHIAHPSSNVVWCSILLTFHLYNCRFKFMQVSQHHPSYPFSCSFKLVCFLFSFTKRTKKKPLKITTKLRNCRGIFPHIHIHTHEYNLCLVHTPENLKIPISNAMYKYHCLFCFDHIILFVCKIGFVVTLFRTHAVITSINLIHPYIL